MPVARLLAGATEGDILEQRDVVLDHGRHPYHEPRSVIEENALPEPRHGVNVGLEHAG